MEEMLFRMEEPQNGRREVDTGSRLIKNLINEKTGASRATERYPYSFLVARPPNLFSRKVNCFLLLFQFARYIVHFFFHLPAVFFPPLCFLYCLSPVKSVLTLLYFLFVVPL